MDVEFPFMANKLSLNNRIYPNDVLNEAIIKYKKQYVETKHAFLYSGMNQDITNICSQISDINLSPDGKVSLCLDTTVNPKQIPIKEFLESGTFTLTPVGIGNLSDKQENGSYLVSNYEIEYIALISNEPLEQIKK